MIVTISVPVKVRVVSRLASSVARRKRSNEGRLPGPLQSKCLVRVRTRAKVRARVRVRVRAYRVHSNLNA